MASDDNIHYLSDYIRKEPCVLVADDGNEINIRLLGRAAQDVRRVVLEEQVELSTFIGDTISLGVMESDLLRDGWIGPVWQRNKLAATRIGRLRGLLGNLTEVEKIITKRPGE